MGKINKLEKHEIEKQYHTLLNCFVDSSIMPIILVNREGIVIKINEAYSKWSGISTTELEGSHITEYVDNTRTHIVAQSGIAELQQLQYAFGKTILSNRIPIFNSKGDLIGACGIVDADEYGEIVKLFNRIEQQKKVINQYKNELQLYEQAKYTFDDIIGKTNKITKTKQDAKKVAQYNVDVIIRGDTGTGKELFAHSIHNASTHFKGPFISINCSAFSYSLVESELFGYEGGSFTNADKTGRKGKFELARGGTIFLDEIGDLPIAIQPKILRVIESREVTRIGGNKAIPLDIQIISATNRNLEDMIKKGLYREDLYYRLTSFMLEIPSLSERREDIPILTDYFVNKWCQNNKIKPKKFSEDAMNDLIQYDWPGNVRELYNYVRNAIIRTPVDSNFYTHDLLNISADNINNQDAINIEDYKSYDLRVITSVLKRTSGNIKRAGEILQIDRNTIYRRLKKYDIDISKYRKTDSQE